MKVKMIIIHCSDSEWGTASEIKKWHTQPPPKGRGWSRLGYHFVICNGYPTYISYKDKKFDKKYLGALEIGSPENVSGIHCEGDNSQSIGICLIGDKTFPEESKITLYTLLGCLLVKYDLNVSDIYGHCERPSGIRQGKTCPNLDMDQLRKELIVYLANQS